MESTMTDKFRDQLHDESLMDYLDCFADFLDKKWNESAPAWKYLYGDVHVNYGDGRPCEVVRKEGSVELRAARRNVLVISYDEDGQGEVMHCGPDEGDSWSINCQVDLKHLTDGEVAGLSIDMKYRY